MARRITGRDKVLVPAHMSPMRLMEARTLCQPESMANSTKIRFYEWDREVGTPSLEPALALAIANRRSARTLRKMPVRIRVRS